MTDSKTDVVIVYVRLCNDRPNDCREISFKIPDEISQSDVLAAGFAIDGYSATMSAMPYENGNEYVTLSDALRSAQVHLAGWLAERGYEVEFK